MTMSTVLKKVSMAAVGVTLVTLGAVRTAQAETIVSPNNLATQEGDVNNIYPFGESPSARNQQVFAASDFSSLAGPALITQIAFRPDATFGTPFSVTIPNIEINLSTTSKKPDALSVTFADNIGSDNTVVFSGPLLLSSASTGPITGPKDFDIVINLQTPFLYNPALGNLLLDVKKFSGELLPPFDAQNSLGDSVSRRWISDVNSPTALRATDDTNPNNYSNSIGLVTQFTLTSVTSVPEPSSALGVLAFGALSAGFMLKRKQKSASSVVSMK